MISLLLNDTKGEWKTKGFEEVIKLLKEQFSHSGKHANSSDAIRDSLKKKVDSFSWVKAIQKGCEEQEFLDNFAILARQTMVESDRERIKQDILKYILSAWRAKGRECPFHEKLMSEL